MKEMILRFFFPRALAQKKNRWVKSRDLILTGCGFFQVLGFRSNLVDGFFFRTKIPREKKTRKIVRQGGRKEDICDNRKKKKHTPLLGITKKRSLKVSLLELSGERMMAH